MKNTHKERPIINIASFANFVYNNFLDDFVTEQLSLYDKLNVPLLQLLSHLSKEEFHKVTLISTKDFLKAMINDTAINRAHEILNNWESHIPMHGVHHKDIQAKDLILIYYAQKTAILKFIPHYTGSVTDAIFITRKLDEHFMQIQTMVVEMLFSMQKQNEVKLLEAEVIGKTGSYISSHPSGDIHWSPGIAAIFELTDISNLVDRDILTRFTLPEELANTEREIEHALIARKPFEFTYKIKINGQEKTIKNSGIVEEAEEGVLIIRGTISDVTSLIQQIKADEQKDEFIGIASHELKTPLTSIKAYLQLLERTFPKDIKNTAGVYSKKILTHVKRLESLITGFLDVSHINAGKLELNYTSFDFYGVLTSCLNNVKESAWSHSIVYKGNRHIIIEADKGRIEQVISNLVSNAIKYSPQKNLVNIHVRTSHGKIYISVEDYGIGIPQDSLNKIFNRFYRVESTSAKFQGMGTGLYITNEIIKKHHGKIWVESQAGKGTTFHVSLPLKKVISNK